MKVARFPLRIGIALTKKRQSIEKGSKR